MTIQSPGITRYVGLVTDVIAVELNEEKKTKTGASVPGVPC
jgi:hypothetical protein